MNFTTINCKSKLCTAMLFLDVVWHEFFFYILFFAGTFFTMRRVQFLDDGGGERISNHKVLDQQNAQDYFDIHSLQLDGFF